MKVTLDLSDLVSRGELTKEEADRLARLSASDTGSLGSNIFLAFGTVAVALGAGALVPTLETALALGLLLFAFGLGLRVRGVKRWTLFAQIALTLGALTTVGALSIMFGPSLYPSLSLAAALAVAAALAQSGLLAALAVLELAVALGSGTAYWHASYGLWVERPTLSILVLAVLTLALYLLSQRLLPAYERICLIAARTTILMINAAFLVGSLFGDASVDLPASVFTIGWALVLLGALAWAVWLNRRWVVNTTAVFGAVHFYTQWFEFLGPSALSIIGGGLLLIAFGVALRWLNGRKRPSSVAV